MDVVSNLAHAIRIFVYWLICSLIAELLLWKVIPTPGPRLSDAGEGENTTMGMLIKVGAPLFVFICVYMVYAIMNWRDSGESEVRTADPAKTSIRGLFIWCAITFSTVIFLATWGTFTLGEITNAAGPNPLVIQVIAQQWHFTYRYPTYGGFETFDLHVPVNTPIKFEITSIDVVHDFWIYNEDVKEDAVPGTTTVANLRALTIGKQWIVCDELCGIWHGNMRGPMYVTTMKDFTNWANQEKVLFSPVMKDMPPQSDTYFPDPQGYPSPPQNSAQ